MRTMRVETVSVVLVAVLSVGCAHRFECAAHRGDPVYRLESQHFQVTGELRPVELELETRRLERLWDAFGVFFGGIEPRTTARIPVVMVTGGAVAEFIEGYAGFVAGEDSPVLVTTVELVHGTSGAERLSTSAHELVHLMAATWLPPQPRWLSEGLAQYLGDATFKHEDVVRFGRWRWTGGDVDALESLWAWKGPAQTEDEEHRLYDSSWAWLHFLANKEEVRLNKLWAAMRIGKPPSEAFSELFPFDEWDSLHARVEQYLRDARFSGWESTVFNVPKLSSVRQAEPWEVHLLRAEIFTALRDSRSAFAETRLAKEQAGAQVIAEVEVAVIEHSVVGPARSDALAPWADGPAAFALATAVDVGREERFARLEALAAKEPGSLRVALAHARAALGLRSPRSVELARRAIDLAPWSVSATTLLAEALLRERKCDEAKRTFRQARLLASEVRGATARLNALEKEFAACDAS